MTDFNEQTILFRHLAGSKLYGTDLPTSDNDYKEIYIPSPREILLGRTSLASQTTTGNDKGRNTADDEDLTRMSVQKFLFIAAKGDVGAIETLFSANNPDAVFYQHDLWGEVINIRSKVVNRSIYKSLGYIRSQVNRYVVKGTRADAVRNILEILRKHPKGKRLEDIIDEIKEGIKDHEFSSLDIMGDGILHLNVCNRKAPIRNKIGDTYDTYKKLDDEYGARTKAAQNLSGVDWKGIGHATRIGQQMVELLETGNMTLPRPNKEHLIRVRKGEIPIEQATSEIDYLFEKIEELGTDGDYGPSVAVAEEVSSKLHLHVLKEYIESLSDATD